MRRFAFLIALFSVATFLTAFCLLNDWRLIESRRCNAMFPNVPRHDSTMREVPGGIFKMHSYIYETSENSVDSNLLYGLFESRYPSKYFNVSGKAATDSFYAGVVEGAIEQVKGKFVSLRQIAIDNQTGRELTINYSNGALTVTTRMILIDTTLLSLQVISPSGQEKNGNAEKFLHSWQLK